MRAPILITGPTASGKSALALEVAARVNGAIVNADAFQAYREWRILTARPDADEEARAPHMLYGHVSVTDLDYSVGRWLDQARDALARCAERGLTPVFVGGASLYLSTLIDGLAEIPETRPELRAAYQARRDAEGLASLVAELRARDPETAAGLDLNNPRRVQRALEVLTQTGIGMKEWARRTPPPLVSKAGARRVVLETPVNRLDRRIRDRLARMLSAGLLEEARTVAALELSESAPAMMAHGARAFIAHLRGDLALEDAIERTAIETRRYAKRQRSWARSRFADWRRLPAPLDGDAGAIAERLLSEEAETG